MNRLRTIMMIACALILMTSTLWSAQTTDFGGQVASCLFDKTRIAAAGIVKDSVLIWDYSADKFELSDTWGGGGAGANIEDGTSQGQIAFWDQSTGSWRHSEITEAYWDDNAANKSLIIGDTFATLSPLAYLSVGPAELNKATNYSGVSSIITKEAGASDVFDDYAAFMGDININQAGGTVGKSYGATFGSTMTVGTATEIAGLSCDSTHTNGTLIDQYGILFDVNSASAIGTNIYGIAGSVDNTGLPDTIVGTIWGIDNEITSVGGATAIFGAQNNITKTSDNLTGNFYGVQTNVTNTAGDIGGYWVNTDLINIQTAGTVAQTFTGLSINNDQNGGTVSGSCYGIYVSGDYDGTTTGKTYDIYLAEGTGTDYGVYQNGTAMNYYGGSETVIGNTVNPFVALTIADGANEDVACPVGTNLYVAAAGNSATIGGLTLGVAGRRLELIWLNANRTLTLTNESVGSVAANRITTMTGADVVTTASGTFTLIYDGTTSRWIVTNSEL